MPAPTLSVPPDIGVPSLGGFADALIASLALPRPVRLDISTMTTSDPSVLQLVVQLIAAARRHASDIGSTITLVGPATPAFASVLERGGFLAGTPDDLAFWSGDKQR
jgi:hypothetical protein